MIAGRKRMTKAQVRGGIRYAETAVKQRLAKISAKVGKSRIVPVVRLGTDANFFILGSTLAVIVRLIRSSPAMVVVIVIAFGRRDLLLGRPDNGL
jgi:hypothetical protein